MKTIIVKTESYTVVDLTIEYAHWTGVEKYAVVSDLPQEDIEKEFAAELTAYKPYIFMPMYFLEIRRDYRNNDNKFAMRSVRNEVCFGYEDCDTEIHHNEAAQPDFADNLIQNITLKNALKELTEKERTRTIEYYFHGKTLEAIGAECGCSARAVKYSIDSAAAKLKKFLQEISD